MAFELKRFWQQANVVKTNAGYAVHLDERPLKTPLKNLVIVPSRGFALAIAEEWNAVDSKIHKHLMPYTRFAEAALDAAATEYNEIVANLTGYGETDLLCYRAVSPIELIKRQSEIWDPLLDWADKSLAGPLRQTSGVMAITQDPVSIENLSAYIKDFDLFQLSAFYDLVKLSGSLIIALAVAHNHIDAAQGWKISRLDDEWQIEQWGTDDEAEQLAASKRESFLTAHNALNLLTNI